MRLRLGTPGIARFIFVALLLVFNWPLLSIPAPESLLGWLFTAWGLAIGLLLLAARGASDEAAGPPEPWRNNAAPGQRRSGGDGGV